MLDSAVAAGTTDFAIAVDRKSVPGTAAWVRSHLRHRRGLLATLLRPARVVHFEWQDDFAHARNVALDIIPADCEWWISIDADIRLDCLDGATLPEYLRNVPGEVQSICIPYLDSDKDGLPVHTTSYETFFRSPVTYRWKRAWGEIIEPLDRTHILHGAPFRRVHDPDRSIPRMRERNHRIILKAVKELPDDPTLWGFLSDSYARRREFDRAATCLLKAATLASAAREQYGYGLFFVDLMMWAGRLDAALEVVIGTTPLQPHRPEALILEGHIRFLLGDFTGAVTAIDAALVRMPASSRVEERQHTQCFREPDELYDCRPFYVLAVAWAQLGDFDRALSNADRAVAASSCAGESFARYLEALRNQLAARERPSFARGAYEKTFHATTTVIRKILTYDSAAHLAHDLAEESSEISRMLRQPFVDRDAAMDYVEMYVGERVNQAATPTTVVQGSRTHRTDR